MRRDYFYIGLGCRIMMLGLFIILNQNNQYNDASEIIYYAFQELFKGNNPYSKIYTLHWGESTFTQPFNYGPVTLLLYLPAMLIPYWFNSLWLGMAVMINIYNFLIAELLSKYASRDKRLQQNAHQTIPGKDPRINRLLYYGGVFFWMIPVGTTCITVFIYGPILLLLLALHTLDRPFWSMFWICLGGLSYQLILLMIPVFGIYHLKKSWQRLGKILLGATPSITIFLFFGVWGEGGIFDSLVLYNVGMPYSKCPQCGHNFDRWSVFSIPRILYNLSNGNVMLGPVFRYVFAAILFIICILYLFTNNFDRFQYLFIIKYSIWVVLGFTLTTNYGQSHYLIFLYPLLFYYFQAKKPDFRKTDPIGPGIYSWEEYNQYIQIYQEIPK